MADRPFEDLVIIDSVQDEDLLLVSADHVTYATRYKTILDALIEALGGPGFVIRPDDLGLKLDRETRELYFTYKGVRCEKGVQVVTVKK